MFCIVCFCKFCFSSCRKNNTGQVKMRLILQLICVISRVLQKLLKCVNGTTISTFSVLPSSGVFSIILILDLNDSEYYIILAGILLYSLMLS